MKSTQKQAIDKLNDLLSHLRGYSGQQIKNNVQILVQGINELDQEVKQKEQLLVQKDKSINKLQGSIFDKEQKEFVEVLSQRYPHDYPTNFNEWPNDIWGKQVVERKDLQAIEKHLPTFKIDVLKNKFIEVLQQRFPHDYSARFEDWPNIWGKQVINRGDVGAMQKWIPIYEKEIKENLSQSILSEKRAKENELRKLTIKEQETLELKEQLRLKEVETQSKDQLLLAKELEKQESLALKENELREKEELLLAKESEVHNKSAEKNRIIEELLGNLLAKDEEIASKSLKIGEVSQSVKKANRKLVAKDKLLNDKEQRIEELKLLIEQNKELIAQQELALVNKSHMKNQIIDELEEEVNLQGDEIGNLRVLNLEKELMTQEQEKLLIQKELELADKSLVKNQLIKEAKKLLAEKDNEFQDLLDHNAELIDQNEVLDLKMQYYDMEVKNREAEKEIFLTQKQKLSFLVSQKEQEFQNLLIQKEIEQKELLMVKELAVTDKSFEKNQIIEQLREDITNLKQKLLDNQPIYRSIYLEDRSCQPGESLVERQMASLDLSSINLSPIDHGVQNQILGNVIGNFDNQHITHSVVLGGEGSESFTIIDTESFY
jgi:hypothetical protein